MSVHANWNRRRILAGAAATIAAPSVLRAQGLSGTITLMSYAGIFQDNYTKAVVEPFLKANPGVKVNYAPGGTSAQMLGTIRAQKADPQVDVVIFDVTTSGIGNIEGLFSRMSPEEVPSLNDLDPQARAAGGRLRPGRDLRPSGAGLRQAEPESALGQALRSLASGAQGAGGARCAPNIQGLALTAMVAKMEGGDHTKSIDPAIRKLKDLAPSVQTWEPNPDGYTLILNGVVRVATGWNARAQLYSDETKGRLGVLLPPEGSVFQINTINVTEGSKNKAAAIAFANYALSREAQKAFTERMFYAPTNIKAEIAPAALARTASSPENRARMIPVDWTEIAKVRDQWNNRWRREIIAAR